MQLKMISAALISLSLMSAGPAFAQTFTGTAKLATPVAAASTTTIGSADWRCDGDTCLGTADRIGLDSFMKECRKVAAAVGPLSAYSSRGRIMTPGNLKTCNKLADANKADNQLAAK